MSKPLRIDILTIFPEMVSPYADAAMLGRAQKKRLLVVKAHQLRDWTHDRHKSVDDRPFGGGPGMVMKVAPIHEALVSLGLRTKKGVKTAKAKKTRVVLTSAKGKLFTQKDARRLSTYDRLVFVCGRYEGVDERVAAKLCDEELAIGPYVLTGGELAALVMTDAVARLRPGVLGKETSLDQESWSDGTTREYPQYTRPEVYLGWKVPKQLLTGHHKNVEEWRKGKMKGAP
ncbi:tRNA (guanosine(37)-N1)-methyltransferase TrmD [Patescibacteria group bacterium]|nr:tRNA (guanosine(37)-N1)-methyltransferase TrmD [Patescibacteria group bacterium]